MNNPWVQLPHIEPFVLKEDRPSIQSFNQSADELHQIHLELLPEPFIGDPNAPVVLLNLNPGYNVRDIRFHQSDEYFIRSLRNNLEQRTQEYPFYPLDPRNGASPASRHCLRRLDRLIKECGPLRVAHGVLVVEFFPYHSKKYKRVASVLASQRYSFYLVEQAIHRKAIVVLMRSEKRWRTHVSQLNEYPVLKIRSWQNPTITKKNLRDGFDEIVGRLGKREGA
jgi:hypothetical protein